MRLALAEVVRGHQSDRTLPAGADPEALAALLMTIIPGFILHLALFGAFATQLRRTAMHRAR